MHRGIKYLPDTSYTLGDNTYMFDIVRKVYVESINNTGIQLRYQPFESYGLIDVLHCSINWLLLASSFSFIFFSQCMSHDQQEYPDFVSGRDLLRRQPDFLHHLSVGIRVSWLRHQQLVSTTLFIKNYLILHCVFLQWKVWINFSPYFHCKNSDLM